MGSALVYVVVVALVAGAVFLLVSLVFGRGEELAPMPQAATPTRLPARDLTGEDVRELRFQQALRGYKCSEVDWALERLGAEVDALRARLEVLTASAPEGAVPPGDYGPGAPRHPDVGSPGGPASGAVGPGAVGPGAVGPPGVASGEYASGEYASGEYASGEYASGEYASGEYASGGVAPSAVGSPEDDPADVLADPSPTDPTVAGRAGRIGG